MNGFSRPTKLDISLAPLEGVTDLPFRLWMSLTSAPEACWTPFLRVTATFPKSSLPLTYAPELGPLKSYVAYRLTPQVMGSSVDDIMRVSEDILTMSPIVDLNCGCPSPNAVGSRAGSSLLQDHQFFHKFISKLTSALGPRVLSVKMRTGFSSHQEFPDLLDVLGSLPLAQLGLHGRTRHQRYDGYSRWHLIQEAAQRLPYPVYGSGDILSLETLNERLLEAPSLQKVLVGRGALRNPWIFSELRDEDLQRLTPEILPYALACLGILYQAYLEDTHLLFEMVKSGHFLSSCGTDVETWRQRYRCLATHLNCHHSPQDLQLAPFVLGRVKMIWNYMRSHLPDVYFAPIVLRSKTFPELLQQIQSCYSDPKFLVLQHSAKYDWIYTSKKKAPETTDILFS